MEWHYGVANTVHGPVSDEEFLGLVRDRTVRPDTLVWAPYLTDWVPAEEIEGLFIAARINAPSAKAKESPPPRESPSPTREEKRRSEEIASPQERADTNRLSRPRSGQIRRSTTPVAGEGRPSKARSDHSTSARASQPGKADPSSPRSHTTPFSVPVTGESPKREPAVLKLTIEGDPAPAPSKSNESAPDKHHPTHGPKPAIANASDRVSADSTYREAPVPIRENGHKSKPKVPPHITDYLESPNPVIEGDEPVPSPFTKPEFAPKTKSQEPEFTPVPGTPAKETPKPSTTESRPSPWTKIQRERSGVAKPLIGPSKPAPGEPQNEFLKPPATTLPSPEEPAAPHQNRGVTGPMIGPSMPAPGEPQNEFLKPPATTLPSPEEPAAPHQNRGVAGPMIGPSKPAPGEPQNEFLKPPATTLPSKEEPAAPHQKRGVTGPMIGPSKPAPGEPQNEFLKPPATTLPSKEEPAAPHQKRGVTGPMIGPSKPAPGEPQNEFLKPPATTLPSKEEPAAPHQKRGVTGPMIGPSKPAPGEPQNEFLKPPATTLPSKDRPKVQRQKSGVTAPLIGPSGSEPAADEAPKNEFLKPPAAQLPSKNRPKVQRQKSGVTGPLVDSSDSESVEERPAKTKTEPKKEESPPENDRKAESDTPSFYTDLEQPKAKDKPAKDKSAKTISARLPLWAKVGILVGVSAASAFGIYTYRGEFAATDPSTDEQNPTGPDVPKPAPLKLAQPLSHHLIAHCPTTPRSIVAWDLARARLAPEWIKAALPGRVTDLFRQPASLPEWIHEAQPESALIVNTEVAGVIDQIAFIRFSDEGAAILEERLDRSDATPLPAGKELIPFPPSPSPEPSDPNPAPLAAVYIDPHTIVTARVSTLRAIYAEPSGSKNRFAGAFGAEELEEREASLSKVAIRNLLIAVPGKAQVAIFRPESAFGDSKPPNRWEITALTVDADILRHEKVVVTNRVDGKLSVVSADLPKPHPDFLFERVLYSAEVSALEDTRRFGRPFFKGGHLTTIPKEVLLGEIVEPADPDADPPDPIRYLPDRFRGVVTYDLKRLRENPLFAGFRTGKYAPPRYWRELDNITYGLQTRDLDTIVSCSSAEGTVHILVARFKLAEETFADTVNLHSGYAVKGTYLYPMLDRTPDSPYLGIVDQRIAIVGPGAMLERILRTPPGPEPTLSYMTTLLPQIESFEKSVILRVEGRTADGRYQGVQALFFGETLTATGYNSRRIVKCSTTSMADEFNRIMRRRREDAADADVGSSVSDLISIGMDGNQLVVGALVPTHLWDTYSAYFKNVILPEGS